MLEKQVKTKVLRVLKKLQREGIPLWYYMPVQMGMGRAGIPDFVVCINGRFVAIETKRDRKAQLSVRQAFERKKIENAGGLYLVIHDENYPSLERALRDAAIALQGR